LSAVGQPQSAVFALQPRPDGRFVLAETVLVEGSENARAGIGALAYDEARSLLALGLPMVATRDAAGNEAQAVGKVVLYQHLDNGAWMLRDTLVPRSEAGDAETLTAGTYGAALTFHQGDLIVARSAVGSAPGYARWTDPATLFVLRERGGRFEQVQRISISNSAAPRSNLELPLSVLSRGDELLVGSYQEDVTSPCGVEPALSDRCNSGVVHVFARSDGSYRERADLRLAAPVAERHIRFGSALAAADDVLLIGAPGSTGASTANPYLGGSVFWVIGPRAVNTAVQRYTPELGSPAGFGTQIVRSGRGWVVSAPLRSAWTGRVVWRDEQALHVSEPYVGALYALWRDGDVLASAELPWPLALRSPDAMLGTSLATRSGLLFASARGSKQDGRGRLLVYRAAEP
jgi:hypothetical protein